jgi:hypothetical protein
VVGVCLSPRRACVRLATAVELSSCDCGERAGEGSVCQRSVYFALRDLELPTA